MIRRPPSSTLFPYPPLFRSAEGRRALDDDRGPARVRVRLRDGLHADAVEAVLPDHRDPPAALAAVRRRRGLHPPVRADRKSTRLNSSHLVISYAVFCLKKNN